MLRFHPAIVISVLSLVALVGCSTAKKTTSDQSAASNSASPAAESSSQAATKTETPNSQPTAAKSPRSSEYSELNTVVSTTQTAVEAGDFAKAKADFDTFEAAWSKVEDGVKAKSSKTYDAIEAGADQAKAAIKAKQRDQALRALQTMSQEIASVS